MRRLSLFRHFGRLSFKSKLFLSYMLIVLIPVSVSGAWIYNQVIVPARGERLLLIEQAMNQLLTTVDKEVDDIEKTGYLISTNNVLKKSLLKRYYDESEIIEVMNTSIQSLLSWFVATHKDIGEFHFFNVNETLPESRYFIPLSTVDDQPWFLDIKTQFENFYPYWENRHTQREYPYRKDSHQPVYSMFYPINEDFPDDTSYLEFEIDISHFFAKLEALTLSSSGFVLALDWDGQIAYAPQAAVALVEKPQDLTTLQQIDPRKITSGELTFNGIPYRYEVKPIQRLQTSLVGLVPLSDINGPWNQTKNIFILLILFLTILLAVLSFLLSGLLIKKIVRIISNVRKIQNGNFQVRIPVHGEDEIDRLALNINAMASQIDELINRVYKSQVSQKEAELMALQAQINPHFLFNTLETLRMMAETRDEQQLSDAITALGSIMRYNINNGNISVTLATEIEHIQDYIQIQNLLHNERIVLHCNIPDKLQSYQVPNLLLQPIVENAVVHGMKGHVGSLFISITITEDDSNPVLRCVITDNGSGIEANRLELVHRQLSLDPEQRSPLSEANSKIGRSGGVALTNVSDRIKHYYERDSGIELSSEPGQGTTVTITLPTTPEH